MRNRVGIILICVAVISLAGCTYLQNLFPDKERDYQYTTEIPMLNWPTELRNNQAASSAESLSPSTSADGSGNGGNTDYALIPPANGAATDHALEETPSTSPDTSGTPVTPATESDERDSISSVEIIKYDDGESRMRLGAGFSKSWRAVNKGLSRNTIEVTDRNHDKGQITVYFDPDEKKAKDESFLDEINFIFKGININDKEFVLKLEEHGQQTDVIVLDEEHMPLLNDEAALRLLRVLVDTIKADLADKAK